MAIQIQVENIKCGGCAGTIKKKLLANEQVSGVEVDIDSGVVSIELAEAQDGTLRALLAEALLKMGYPETGTAEGIAAARAKAKSFVSCAVGRVDNMVGAKD